MTELFARVTIPARPAVQVVVPAPPIIGRVAIAVPGPQGIPGVAGDSIAREVSFVNAASWSYIHNFGRRPGVACYDAAGHEFDADVTASDTSVLVELAQPMTGKLVLT